MSDFQYDFKTYRVGDISTPECMIAYDEEYIINLLEKYSLKLIHPTLYGSWCNRKTKHAYNHYQDLIVVSK